MSGIPTLEEKLHWLKPVPATDHELKCVEQIGLGEFEIGFQRTNDILDEGMDVFVRSCRSAMGIAGDWAGCRLNCHPNDLQRASAAASQGNP